MKNIWIILLSFFSFSISMPAQDHSINVMSFNIRLFQPDDGFNFWPNRKDLVASMIQYHEADIIGVQEAFRVQLDDLAVLLPDYEWTGLCRTDGSKNPNPDNEFSAILYRKDRFELLEEATFWLSKNPDQVGGKSWDAALPRIVSWAKFRDKKNDQVFFHFNTHFDHRGVIARAESAKLIKQKVAEIGKTQPVILTGDFNCVETDEPYLVLTNKSDPSHLKDALFLSERPHHGPLGTWTNSFQFPGVPGRRIDFIFVKNSIKVLKHAILSDSWSGRLPSDHLPVISKLELIED